jgi:Domain of unknown function (DUF4190)
MSQDTSYSGTTTTTREGNGLAVAGLVCGLVGLLVLPIVLGPLAVIFGGVGWSKANHGARHKGMAIAAVVLGIVDLILMGVLIAAAVNNGGSSYWHVG